MLKRESPTQLESVPEIKEEFKIDEHVVLSLIQLGYPWDYILKSLKENDHNYCTMAYHLLSEDNVQ